MTHPSLSLILLLGSLAGFTIYLGLPFALVPSKKLRTFANALSVGVLFFILVDILNQLFESIKDKTLEAITHHGSVQAALVLWVLFFLGLAGSYLGLVFFETKWIQKEKGASLNPVTLALIIAVGIGLHNFSEGLAIGQELVKGAVKLGYLLVVGFALHNATEGFGIAAPLTGEKPSLSFLFVLGLIGGGPTMLGTLVGESFKSPWLEMFFLALASGAIFYVIGELSHLGKLKGNHKILAFGILIGLFLAFGSDILIEASHAFVSP